jgi:hypothetical protein
MYKLERFGMLDAELDIVITKLRALGADDSSAAPMCATDARVNKPSTTVPNTALSDGDLLRHAVDH